MLRSRLPVVVGVDLVHQDDVIECATTAKNTLKVSSQNVQNDVTRHSVGLPLPTQAELTLALAVRSSLVAEKAAKEKLEGKERDENAHRPTTSIVFNVLFYSVLFHYFCFELFFIIS